MKPIMTVCCAEAVAAARASAAVAASLNMFMSSLLLRWAILTDDPDAADARLQLDDPALLAGLAGERIAGERRRGRCFTEQAHQCCARADHHLAPRERQLDEVAVAPRQHAHEAGPARGAFSRIVGDDESRFEAQSA